MQFYEQIHFSLNLCGVSYNYHRSLFHLDAARLGLYEQKTKKTKCCQWTFVWTRLINLVCASQICCGQTQLQRPPFKPHTLTPLVPMQSQTARPAWDSLCVRTLENPLTLNCIIFSFIKNPIWIPNTNLGEVRWWIGVTLKLMGGIYQRGSVIDQLSFSTLDRAFRARPFVTATAAKIWPIRGR